MPAVPKLAGKLVLAPTCPLRCSTSISRLTLTDVRCRALESVGKAGPAGYQIELTDAAVLPSSITYSVVAEAYSGSCSRYKKALVQLRRPSLPQVLVIVADRPQGTCSRAIPRVLQSAIHDRIEWSAFDLGPWSILWHHHQWLTAEAAQHGRSAVRRRLCAGYVTM